MYVNLQVNPDPTCGCSPALMLVGAPALFMVLRAEITLVVAV